MNLKFQFLLQAMNCMRPIKLYDLLRDMDFELTETQVEVFEKLQDAEVNGGFF